MGGSTTESTHRATLKSGYQEIGGLDESSVETAFKVIVYVLLAVTLVLGVGLFVRSLLIINFKRRNEVIDKYLDDGESEIVRQWKDLAEADQKIRHSNMTTGAHDKWDAETESLYKKIKSDLEESERDQRNNRFSIINILLSGLYNHHANQCSERVSEEIDRAMVTEAEYEQTKMMTRSIEAVRQCAVLAPSLGLLGTVIGISMAFKKLPAALEQGQSVTEFWRPRSTTPCGRRSSAC